MYIAHSLYWNFGRLRLVWMLGLLQSMFFCFGSNTPLYRLHLILPFFPSLYSSFRYASFIILSVSIHRLYSLNFIFPLPLYYVMHHIPVQLTPSPNTFRRLTSIMHGIPGWYHNAILEKGVDGTPGPNQINSCRIPLVDTPQQTSKAQHHWERRWNRMRCREGN